MLYWTTRSTKDGLALSWVLHGSPEVGKLLAIFVILWLLNYGPKNHCDVASMRNINYYIYCQFSVVRNFHGLGTVKKVCGS